MAYSRLIIFSERQRSSGGFNRWWATVRGTTEPNRADEMVTAKPETVNRAWWACRAISIRVVNLDGCVAISGLEI
jgi:hypothetical protein